MHKPGYTLTSSFHRNINLQDEAIAVWKEQEREKEQVSTRNGKDVHVNTIEKEEVSEEIACTYGP